jgi:hypothetical protein
MKTIFALLFSALIVQSLGLKTKKFLVGDQSNFQKGLGVQAGLGIGAAQVGFDKGIGGVQSGIGFGGAQIGKGIGAVQATPFNFGGYGWNGNGIGLGWGRGIGYPWRGNSVGYGTGWGLAHANIGINNGYGSIGYKGLK